MPEIMPRGRQFSEEVAREIDRAVKAIIDEAFRKAHRVLSENRGVLDLGAERLLQKETLNEDELKELASEVRRVQRSGSRTASESHAVG
jgi:cell division protease FtsH